jgi:hypothetical protein
LSDDPLNVPAQPQPLDDDDLEQSFMNLDSAVSPETWQTAAQRRSLKALDRIERKIGVIHQKFLAPDVPELSLQELSKSLYSAGTAARKYAGHSSSDVVEKANHVLHQHREASNHLLIRWEELRLDAQNRPNGRSSPLDYNVGTYSPSSFALWMIICSML